MERSVEERALLLALAGGRSVTRDPRGWQLGDSRVPVTLIERLVRDELIDAHGARAKLTETGLAWVERDRDPDAPNRVLASRGREGKTAVTQNLGENPLAWLMRRDKITARQFAGGERMRGDYMLSQRMPSVTMRWDAMPGGSGGGGLEPSEAMIAAKKRLSGAKAAAGPGLSDILIRVACEGQELEVAERSFGWPARAGKVVLGLALDRVALFYGV